MPIIVKREDVARLGGKYRVEPALMPTPVGAPLAPLPPLPPPTPTPVTSIDPVINRSLERIIRGFEATQATQASQSEQLAAILNRQGGQWLATVKARDQHGRILAVEFDQQPLE